MKRDIDRRLATLEQVTGSARQVLVAGTTQAECDHNWRDYLASRPSQQRPAPLFIATGVPRASDGMVT